MKRKKRTEILINGSQEIAAALAQEIRDKYEVKRIEEPNNGLVMVKVRETAQKSLFYLGEVFVTEAKVQINDSLGIGIVKGDEPELAYDLAVIDAAYNAGLKETEEWSQLLLSEEQRINDKRRSIYHKVLKTKVNFDMMDIV
ncbi:phosphonate C-P lyase system protein PhnG [Aneurinibacillus terranovensis]|uniref:phosphonate C-P lyase system protein PhnG n=1 Tax=Aneurinibacillus terranovensis TaxID=278991 RepID=UPI00041897A6|nr:phosphonate C-P lyase system protein PhnG [Aneurinibacillus terranovensis]